jgi:hypothetical protein
MQIKKEELAKKLEDLSEKFVGKLDQAVKDITDALMFLCLYGGQGEVKEEEVELIFNQLNSPKYISIGDKYRKDGLMKKDTVNQNDTLSKDKKDSENRTETAQTYFVESYDRTRNLTIITSPSYLKIEKKTEDDSDYYLVEYVLDNKGNFVRNVVQKSFPLGKELFLKEKSDGTLGGGIFSTEITEKNEEMAFNSFKLPGNKKDKREDVFYSYKAKPDHFFMCKASARFKNVPVVNSLGISDLAEILSSQFEEKFTIFEDEIFFKSLAKASKEYYFKKS